METLLGEEIKDSTLGVFYICDYDYKSFKLTPLKSFQFNTWKEALDAYASTPNPPSQVAWGRDREEFEHELKHLHKMMLSEGYQKKLVEYL